MKTQGFAYGAVALPSQAPDGEYMDGIYKGVTGIARETTRLAVEFADRINLAKPKTLAQLLKMLHIDQLNTDETETLGKVLSPLGWHKSLVPLPAVKTDAPTPSPTPPTPEPTLAHRKLLKWTSIRFAREKP